ncbi:LytR/AlgR family response regulator transcription factor [Pontibacter akesuensis]|uniref:Two component transcriptional regulator, LytTR family n=1 Tax=Pontibacter akesuensis TaxID=388950 RepID=A0A1I7HTK0_9BACT|nr:LytTR family DNA-binding domain-containing protein [Pontibacter akesuensis]GHA63516.1 DNA-binding response regulator [Pontibacter akesuensis]SFU64068.1 two component transcriptional regulator, LytTR family [Pontibacter akesuensis]
MRILIVEDEKLASDRLANMLLKLNSTAEVLATAPSVRKAVELLKLKPQLDLIFMDIQLADGLSFEIFEQVPVDAPVIFTTAYDAYAIKAFKVNSVDYLLKPIDEDGLQAALEKFRKLSRQTAAPQVGALEQAMQFLNGGKSYKSRFVVKVGEHLHMIPVEEVDFFYSYEKATFIQCNSGKRYAIDYTMEQLEQLTDPQLFFRVNRGFLISLKAVKDIVAWSNSRLKLELRHNSPAGEVVVSREKVQLFKEWLDR